MAAATADPKPRADGTMPQNPRYPASKRPIYPRDDQNLPGAIRSRKVREFLWWLVSVEAGGSSGGRDYGGATSQDIRDTVDVVIDYLRTMDYGAGADILLVAACQAETCRACVHREHKDERGEQVVRLCRGA